MSWYIFMIVVKKLEEDRWKEYRDLRLEALIKEPIAFGSSYAIENEHKRQERYHRKPIGVSQKTCERGKIDIFVVIRAGQSRKANAHNCPAGDKSGG